MMSKKSRNTIGYLAAVMLAFSVCVGYYYMKDYQTMGTVQAHVEGDMVLFSEDSGVYEEMITVSLTKDVEVPSSASIYYTLNGDDPSVEKTKYTGSIHLEKKKDLTIYPLKAVIYYNGEYSEIYEKTYVLCNHRNRELDVDIVCITSDRDNLYDYETGIFVAGKTYDKSLEEFDGVGLVPGNYSNRGEEWIRNAHVAMFDSEGMLRIEQDIGIGISGGTSSADKVKSLKLYADSIYDKNFDKFYYNMTNDELRHASYSFVNEYNSIRLRSGSQDKEYGNIRSSIVSRLVQLSDADQCTATKRCVVYLNGKYYGIFDMQQNYSNSYLAKRFNLESPEYIERQKGDEVGAFLRSGIGQYFNLDLNDISNRQILEEYVDMDNYLQYYAINVLCNNTDWPGNNFEMWRYTGEYDGNNKYSDGRYRFLIYDTDMTFTSDFTTEFFDGVRGDTFEALMEKTCRGEESTFSNVMASAYYRDKFITYIIDLLNTSFSEKSVQKIIQEENAKIANLRNRYHKKEFVENAEFHVEQMIQAAKERPNEIANLFLKYFGLSDKYEMTLETSEGISVKWNEKCIFANDKYQNQYYKGVRMILEQEAYPGYAFQYWMVNGKKIYDLSLEITGEMFQDGNVEIQAVAANNSTPEVILSALSAKDQADWLRISNVGMEPADLKKYYISDDEKNLLKYQLPNIILESGESIVIYGSKNHETIGDYICNFSLKKGEVLFLSNEIGCKEKLAIPKMSNIEIYHRYDESNVWIFSLSDCKDIS